MTKKLHKLLLALVALSIAIGAYADDYIRHEVKKGETLYGIAHKYNVPYRLIEELNPQAASGVKKGMTVLIPANPQAAQQASEKGSTSNNTTPVQNASDSQPTSGNEQSSAVDSDKVAAETTANDQASMLVPDVYYATSGDTFTTIAAKYGLTVDSLIDLNPFLDPNNLRAGSPVRLKDQAPLVSNRNKRTTPTAIVGDDEYDVDDIAADDYDGIADDNDADTDEPQMTADDQTTTIVVALPFMTASESPNKQAQRYGDFYRGFLLAAQEAGANGPKIEIRALDTAGSIDRMKAQLLNTLAYQPQLVIVPEDNASIAVANDFANNYGVYVLNLFNVRDTSYVDNAYMLQANISQQLMYDKAMEFFVREYQGCTPVFLISEGRSEKMPFVEALRVRYAQMGQPTLTVNFDTYLKASDLEILNDTDRYVFVPASGAMSEFNKIARTLAELKNREGNIDRISLFGYPDWTAFRSESRTRLHELEATIYSRFYYDESDESARQLDDTYYNWYGTSMVESVPMQAILGYDTANMLIDAIGSRLSLSDVLRSGARFRGQQSVFHFVGGGDGGYVNDALYIIKYLPNRITDVRVL